MAQHLRILGILHLVAGGLFVFGAIMLATMMAGAGLITQDAGVFALLSGIGILGALFLAVLGIPGLIVGYGLLKHRSWSRIPAMILGFLNLFNFPFGTLLGGYTLYVLFQPETERLLTSGSTPQWS